MIESSMFYILEYLNRIRLKFRTTRSSDCDFLIDNNFIYRALSASQLGRKFVFTLGLGDKTITICIAIDT